MHTYPPHHTSAPLVVNPLAPQLWLLINRFSTVPQWGGWRDEQERRYMIITNFLTELKKKKKLSPFFYGTIKRNLFSMIEITAHSQILSIFVLSLMFEEHATFFDFGCCSCYFFADIHVCFHSAWKPTSMWQGAFWCPLASLNWSLFWCLIQFWFTGFGIPTFVPCSFLIMEVSLLLYCCFWAAAFPFFREFQPLTLKRSLFPCTCVDACD